MDESLGATTLSPLAGGVNINLNGATAGAAGQVDGTSVSFDGINDYALTASSLDLSARNKIVVEALINVDNYNSDSVAFETPGSFQATTGSYGFFSSLSSAYTPALKGDVGFNFANYTHATAGHWHHFAVVLDKSAAGTNEVGLYVDGALQSAISHPVSADNTNNFGNLALYLMSRSGTSLFTPGKMQHFAVYSDLSASRILVHSQAAGLPAFEAGTLSEVSHLATTASLSWTGSTNATNPVTEQLQRSPSGANTWSNVSGASTSPKTDSGLSPATSYDYRVAYSDASPSTVYSNTVTIRTTPTYPAYAPTSNTVMVGPFSAQSGSPANWNAVESLNSGTISQAGTITRVRLYTVNKTGLTGVYVKIWRKNGSTYDLVGTSENISSSLTAGAFTTVDLSSPITGVQVGDYIGLRIEGSGTNFYAPTLGTGSHYIFGAPSATTPTNWDGQSGTSAMVPVEVYMQAPQFVFIGDSIMAGFGTAAAFSIEQQLSNLTAYTIQNKGVGGQTTSQIASRFTTDVINLHPRVVVIEGGVNDIPASGTKAAFLANWTTMLNAAQASSDISLILVLKIMPNSNLTNTQMQTRDDWNAGLVALAAGYSKALVVDTSTYVGQFRSGGDAGNLWNIQAAYNLDGTHFTQAGNAKLAQALSDAILTTAAPTLSEITPVSTLTNDNTPDYVFSSNEAGTISYGGDCSSVTTSASSGSNTVTFSSLSDGVHSNCTVTVTNFAGNASAALAVSAFSVDTAAPATPGTPDLQSASDSGNSSTDNITSNTTPAFTIGCEPAATVTLLSGSTVLGTGTCSSSTVTITSSALTRNGHYFIKSRQTNPLGNVSADSSTINVTIDTAAPALAQVTPIATPTNDNTPDYVFSSNEVGAASYGGDCSSSTTAISSGNNTVTFAALADGAHSNCAITVTDAAGNASAALAVSAFSVDTVAPTAAITYSISHAVKSGNSLVITATFNEAMANSPAPKIAVSGANTLAATNMTKTSSTIYTYTDTVGTGNGTATVALSIGTDVAGNVVTSAPTSGATFTVDNTAPTVAEVTPVSTPTNDNTPNYVFSSTEAGTISYGGDCSSVTTSASSGNNTVTFSSLSDGAHSNCTVTVTDAAGNASTALSVSAFTVDTAVSSSSSSTATSSSSSTVSLQSSSSESPAQTTGGTRGGNGNNRIVELLLQREASSSSSRTSAISASQLTSSSPATRFETRAALLRHIILRTTNAQRRWLLQRALDLVNRTITRLLK